jgi:hypothetical protein
MSLRVPYGEFLALLGLPGLVGLVRNRPPIASGTSLTDPHDPADNAPEGDGADDEGEDDLVVHGDRGGVAVEVDGESEAGALGGCSPNGRYTVEEVLAEVVGDKPGSIDVGDI